MVNPKKEKEVLEEITWRLDKLENDTLPQVDLNKTEVWRYELSRKTLYFDTTLSPSLSLSLSLSPLIFHFTV